MLFVIFISDLKPVGLDNSLTKYADDTSLLVPERIDVDKMSEEFSRIMKWSSDNKLIVNLAKTKEIVFHRPNPKNCLSPKELEEVERVEVTKLLGVWLQSDMGTASHIEYITHICNQRLYLLNQIRKQGLHQMQLLNVFQAIIWSRILYASLAWYGYASDVHIDSIQKVLRKAKRWHIVNSDFTAVDLLRDNDLGLFHAVKASNHCLNHLFAPKTEHIHSMVLRPRGHKFALPPLKSEFARKSYVNRSLFMYI